MKGKKYKIIAGALIAILAIGLLISAQGNEALTKEAMTDADYAWYDTSSWMGFLSDDLYLSEITIPGTHDSATENVTLGYVMRCQNTSIAEQLENGYRYIDLRLCIDDTDDGQRIKIVHNFANCHVSGSVFSDYLYLDDVTEMIYSFLEENPSEAVIVNMKIEDDDHSVAEVASLLKEEINDNSDYWYTEPSIPTLKEARGKAVLMTRFTDDALIDTGIYLTWDEQNNKDTVDMPYELYVTDSCRLWVQDRYKYAIDDKFDAVVDGLENCEADEDTIFLNFVSTSGSGAVGHPKGYAKQLNALLLDYEFKTGTSYGIIIVDFGSAGLAQHIYLSNAF